MKQLSIQESDDRQTWVVKYPGEQVMADFPRTAEGHKHAMQFCAHVNTGAMRLRGQLGQSQPPTIRLRELDLKIIPTTGCLELTMYYEGCAVREVLNPYELELLVHWLGKYGGVDG